MPPSAENGERKPSRRRLIRAVTAAVGVGLVVFGTGWAIVAGAVLFVAGGFQAIFGKDRQGFWWSLLRIAYTLIALALLVIAVVYLQQ